MNYNKYKKATDLEEKFDALFEDEEYDEEYDECIECNSISDDVEFIELFDDNDNIEEVPLCKICYDSLISGNNSIEIDETVYRLR